MIAFELFWEASFLVKLVMMVLIFLSIYSWTIILNKRKDLIKREKEIKYINDEIEKSNKKLKAWITLSEKDGYFTSIISKSLNIISGLKNVKQSEVHNKLSFVKENMEVMIDRELQNAKKNTAILATIGSVSPYIGLFGTVWGIMNSFIAIGQAKQATLEFVAPGIAEALIATAIGLFAAIPAYIFYNVISNKLDEISEEYDLLKDEFCLTAKESVSKQMEK
jgi:biopolymer transport protein TolQ